MRIAVVPGGIGTRSVLQDAALLDWLRSAHTTSRYTTSVCTGSLLLAAAALLDRLSAHHALERFGRPGRSRRIPTARRVVEHLDQRIITAAGVSAGIDMALRLAELLTDDLTARAQQLMIEYDRQPPFNAGSLATAGLDVLARA